MAQTQTSTGQPTNVSLPQGSQPVLRSGQLGELIVQQVHGRFYEQAYRNNLFNIGFSSTALSATTTGAATSLGAAATPILGLWNASPSTNLVILQTTLQVTTIPASATNPQGFNYYTSFAQGAITLGTKGNAINLKTLQAAGSVATTFTAGATALTGLSGNMTIFRPVAIGPVLNAAGNGTAVSFAQGMATDNVDGSIIVPPLGVLAILTTAATTTAISVAGSFLWEEVPV